MSEWIIFIAVVAAAGLLFRVLFQRKKAAGKNRTYICSKCGEMDCVCHQSEDLKK